tara:strand:- start:76 stop:1239 length:1164 start_codon:yes stop_codon:yes gene_type:complete
MKDNLAIGLMSGTSADGVDAALIKISESGLRTKIQLIEFETLPYPAEVKEMVLAASTSSKGSVDLVCHLNFRLGYVFAKAVLNILKKANIAASKVKFIGSHGQTIRHLPEGHTDFPDKLPSTLQIGEPSVIAEKTGIKTIADFRTSDMAAGGLGAPLAPFAHFLLFHHKEKSRIVHNIGGISNLTFLPKEGIIDKVVAFDTGPGNMLIDGLVSHLSKGQKRFDRDGKWASKGKINKDLLSFMMEQPFIKKPPPKATGREEFGEIFLRKVLTKAEELKIAEDDLVTTITAFTAESIIINYKDHIFKIDCPSEIIFCGGGVHNQFLMDRIKNKLPEMTISTTEKYGISPDAIEAVSFAILANETLHGNFSNLPSVTGAKRKVILGKIVL